MTKLALCGTRGVWCLLIGLCFVSSSVTAAESPVEDSAELFKRLDANSDDVLSKPEIGAYDWLRYDGDNDGAVSRDEFINGRKTDRLQAAIDPNAEYAWKLLDWNHDGWLSGTELDGKYHTHDANGDGRVTKAEFLAARAEIARKLADNQPQPAAQDGWKAVDASNRGVTFEMPGVPSVDEKGDYMFATADKNTVFIVNIREGEENLETTSDARLNAVKEAAEKLGKAKAIGEKKFELAGHPGLTFACVNAEEVEYRYHVLLVGKRLYQLAVVRAAESQASPAMVKHFFASLKIVPTKDVVPAPVPAGDWVVTAVEGYGLSFGMPGKPERDDKGNFTFVTDNGNTAYKVALSMAPQSLDENAVNSLNAVRDAEAKNLKGEIHSEKSFEFQGYKGREFTVALPGDDEQEVRYWLLIAGKRVIELAVVRSSASQTGPALIKRFFASFKIDREPVVPPPMVDGPNKSDTSDNRPATFPLAGSFRGNYAFKSSDDDFGNQSGSMTLNIGSTGKVTGLFQNTTLGVSGEFTGTTDDDGDLHCKVNFDGQLFTLKGTIIKTKSGNLKGTLTQYFGNTQAVGSVEFNLPAK